MSKIIYFNFLLFIFIFLKIAWSEGFLECIDDIPISLEFTENYEECLNFNSDSGVISMVEANTLIDPKEIIKYYSKILPSFGWKIKELSKDKSYMIFNRDKDVLEISIFLMENNFYKISYNFLSLVT